MKTTEAKSLRRRLIAFAAVTGFVLLIFILRLVWLQLVHGDAYYQEATHPSSSVSAAGTSLPVANPFAST